MSEKQLPKLTKTSSSARYSNQDDPARKMTLTAQFDFNQGGKINNISEGMAVDAAGKCIASFRKPMGNDGTTFEFRTADIAKMQEIIIEVADFVAAVEAEEGGAE